MKLSNKFNLIKGLVIAAALVAFSVHSAPSAAKANGIVASGTFAGANDHVTTGGVSIVKTDNGYVVILADNFSLDGAPSPKVGFGKDGKYDKSSELAALQTKTGLQVYQIPASVNVSDFNEIFIWCDKFSVSLGSAVLK